ncbi:hypothetical protein M0R72_04705 [Candidatus Pacearchaeota archaeon]|jgi:hypothetical protein|nr:hypothetical protein [Candidatus Pacearchaeota archaeon]
MENRNKKGSHVGMILSFVIFITFTVFVYTLISPNINTSESKKTLLNEIGLSLIDNMSSDFTTLSVSIPASANPTTNCITLEGILYYAEISPNVIVKNSAQTEQPTNYDPATDFNNLRINRAMKTDLFFKIYSSPEFEKIPEEIISSCSVIPFGGGYEIGSLNSGEYIFEKNIFFLIEYYRTHYDELKTGLKISPGNEFGFEFTLSNGTKVSAIGDLPTQNIYAEDIPVQYIDDEANILSGFINVKVW